MKWVTREHPHTDRIACPWLILRFIEAHAEIVYVARDEVLSYAAREGAISFDAEGAKYTHRDGKCSFEVIVEEYVDGLELNGLVVVRAGNHGKAITIVAPVDELSMRAIERLTGQPVKRIVPEKFGGLPTSLTGNPKAFAPLARTARSTVRSFRPRRAR
jgi:hypothetical protein